MAKTIERVVALNDNHYKILTVFQTRRKGNWTKVTVDQIHYNIVNRQGDPTSSLSAIRSRVKRMVKNGLIKEGKNRVGIKTYDITPAGLAAWASGSFVIKIAAPDRNFRKVTPKQMDVIEFLRVKRHDPEAWLTTRMLSERISTLGTYDQAQKVLNTMHKHGLVERRTTRVCAGPRACWSITEKGKNAWWDGNYRV